MLLSASERVKRVGRNRGVNLPSPYFLSQFLPPPNFFWAISPSSLFCSSTLLRKAKMTYFMCSGFIPCDLTCFKAVAAGHHLAEIFPFKSRIMPLWEPRATSGLKETLEMGHLPLRATKMVKFPVIVWRTNSNFTK